YTLSVTPGPVAQLVITALSSATAGTAFSVTVSALDIENNIVNTGGTVTLTCSSGQTVYPSTVTLTGGKVTTNVTLNYAGYVTLKATGLGFSGTSGGINVTASGADWFTNNLPDAGLQNLARTDFADGSISYMDMVGLLNQSVTETTSSGVTSAILTSLQNLVSSSGASYLHETADVQNLGYKVVDGDASNK